MHKYKEKHDKIAKNRNAIIHYIFVHWRLLTKRFLREQEKHNLEKKNTSLLINNGIFLGRARSSLHLSSGTS
jgi:hypothetical protein